HRGVKVLGKRAGAVLAQIRFAFPGPMNSGRAEILVDPARREVVVHYMEGPFTGFVRNSVGGGVIRSVWNIRLSPLLIPLKLWMLRHFREGAERALERLTTP
ncbi:MAG: SRPBCC family protein, partial [Thermoproteus sp.]|nr:SRPBCC family protein [Thermoproteus sp.]